MKHQNRPRRQAGLTLVEAALAMAVMGVAATLVVGAASTANQSEEQQQATALLDRGKAAVLTYIALHGKPPCPAQDRSGLESCGVPESDDDTTYFPYKTVGLPEPKAGELEYKVAPLGVGNFQVLMNQRPISADEREYPEATSVSFNGLASSDPPAASDPEASSIPLASSTYDRLLDYCQALLPTASAAPRVMTLTLPAVPGQKAPIVGFNRPTRTLEAYEVAAYLNCAQHASLSGRSYFHAHLSSAVMNKAIQDFRTQFEIGYGTYMLDVGEGTWDFANALFDVGRGWSQIMQHISAAAANIWSAPSKSTFEVAQSLVSAVNKTLTFVKAGAKASQLARYAVNMQYARENREINNQLVARAIELHAIITDHARLSASSAFFLNEQAQAPVLGAVPGVVTNSAPNAVYEEMRQTGKNRALGFNEPFGYAAGMQPY